MLVGVELDNKEVLVVGLSDDQDAPEIVPLLLFELISSTVVPEPSFNFQYPARSDDEV